MTPPPAPEALPADLALRLTDFARACKAATRSVSLYPDGHPAITASLARLVDAATKATSGGALAITVLPETLQVDQRAPVRPDAAIGELATLLHQHLVGELRVVNGADPAAWRSFLLLLGRTTEELLAEGGIARLWATTGGTHLQIREIDYAEVLRERKSGAEAAWEDIVTHCLTGSTTDLDPETMRVLLEIAGDVDRLAQLTERIDEDAARLGGVRAQARALVRLFRAMAASAVSCDPARLDEVLANAAQAAGRLSPDVMLELLTERYQGGTELDVVGEVVDRMSDATIATFVASSVVTERGATARLAQAFHALVPDVERRESLVGLAQAEVAQTPLGRDGTFDDLWQKASAMLLSYRDEKFVSAEYARELSTVRTHAIDVEEVSDDPPERMAAWLATISESELRSLDLQLLIDLLRIEEDHDKWTAVVDPVVAHVDDLVLLGDFESAVPLTRALAADAEAGSAPARRPVATAALERLATGRLMEHLVGHLRTIDDDVFEHVKALCHALGAPVIRPLAEALAVEDRGRAFRRLTDVLVSFGSRGRDAVEQLKNSANPAVRRTAIYLLRAFGGNDALPELAPLLDDADTNVQREAIRAIVTIGTDEAYAVLERALTTGSERSRDAILSALGSMRDERAIPLFLHIVGRREYRRTARKVYLSALDVLGSMGGADALAGLGRALEDGEWWAPFRTSAIRAAAAAAIRQVGTPDAVSALEAAASGGSRGVRAAARQQLARGPVAARRPARREEAP
jgi:HEAT repeat protein